MSKTELIQKWLAALRSGDYKQGTSFLKSGNSFCCLGVLCDVVDNTKWEREDNDDEIFHYGNRTGKHVICTILDTEPGNSVDIDKEFQSLLISMNDDTHKTFREIADAIQHHYTEKGLL